MTIGQRIKNRRRELGLTQKQLGELCGMADSAIRKYESGKITPKHQTLQKIADALQVPEWDLVGVDFEDHSDGSSVAEINVDSLNKKIAQKLTTQSHPEGTRLGIILENESEKNALLYLLENNDTDPESTTRLLTAFYKLDFQRQQALIRTAEYWIQEDAFIAEMEKIGAGEFFTPKE